MNAAGKELFSTELANNLLEICIVLSIFFLAYLPTLYQKIKQWKKNNKK